MITQKKPFLSPSDELIKGKELILASKPFAQEDRKKSWMYTISTLLILISVFLGTTLPVHWSIRLVFSILSGLCIVRFFIIYHDYLHKAILHRSALAEAIMVVFGVFVLAPTTIWRRTHDHHHTHNSKLSNGGIGSYPLVSVSKYSQMSAKQRFVYLATRHPITILLGYITLFTFDFNVKSIIKSPKNHWDSLVALVVHYAAILLIWQVGGLETLLLSWLVPFFLAHAMGSYLFYAQHNFPGATFVENNEWNYAQAALCSTSYIKMGPVMNWFTGNIGYHHVHHINHRIPFYRLREAMDSLSELQSPITTSLHPLDVVKCLRLKVWDPEKGEMVGLTSTSK